MAMTDEIIPTYLFGTHDEVKEYLEKNKNDDSGFYLGYMFQGYLLGPVCLFAFPPLGILIEADVFYRIGKGMFSKKCKGNEPPGLIGRVRELYKAMKS